MANDSVDDMYKNCTKQMYKEVNDKYLNKELDHNSNFNSSWTDYEECVNKTYMNRDPEDKDLVLDHFKALYSYTSDYIYGEFNIAVRTKRHVRNSKKQ